MAIESAIVKAKRSLVNPKFSTRKMRRCFRCGRNHGYMREFNICRICFRELATKGDLPGIKKASW